MNGEAKPGDMAGAGGMAGVLTTLASSGDNWVKLLIVGGLILNGVVTKKEGADTRLDVDKVRQTELQQVRTIYRNQSKWAAFAKATDKQNQLIMEALNIPKEKWPVLPVIQLEHIEEEGENQ